MGKIYLDSDRDANMRLRHCVLFYQGEPVFVKDCGANRALVCNLLTGEDHTVDTQELASSSQVTLGNVPVGDGYINCERKATRRYKHGLCIDNIHARDMPFEADVDVLDLMSRSVGEAITGQYRTCVEAIQAVLSGAARAVPFSKDFGVANVQGVPTLLYKNKQVGIVEDEEVTIFSKFFYLKERLLSHLN
ncbi:hypothetical protein [Salinivibrio phage CW02]|uniref:Uncharacterized protein n=1 Tax=Salinivibrio phage CW02 TaxID=1161935 RepID=H9D1D2_9CAUD|nr:hypothetical protein F490_gp63 [Salinivibrio phage CW02]AFE86174.1 hypothetical protein [Salinivibrio phage CW02]